jgi:hypothetical protein
VLSRERVLFSLEASVASIFTFVGQTGHSAFTNIHLQLGRTFLGSTAS